MNIILFRKREVEGEIFGKMDFVVVGMSSKLRTRWVFQFVKTPPGRSQLIFNTIPLSDLMFAS